MKFDIGIIKELMSLVKQNPAKPENTWSEIAKYGVIVVIKVVGFTLSVAGFAWVITHF